MSQTGGGGPSGGADADARPPPHHRSRALSAMGLILAVGPPAGSLVLSTTLAVVNISESVTRGSFVADLPQLITSWLITTPLIALLSYLNGIVPALLSCLWLGWRIYKNGTVSMAESICTGAAAALICALGVSVITPDFPNNLRIWLIFFGPAGIFSAFVCRWLLGRLGILPSSSPKAPA